MATEPITTEKVLAVTEPHPWARPVANAVRVAGILVALTAVLARRGFYEPLLPLWLVAALELGGLAVYAGAIGWARYRGDSEMVGWPAWTLIVVAVLGLHGWALHLGPGRVVAEAAMVALAVREAWLLNVGLSRLLHRPGLPLVISFLMLITAGTLLIKLPVAVPPGHELRWLDALFTMTSAVCVTGLIVRDTATEFTAFGQALIGLFIQLGGLGIIIFGTTLALLVGRRLSLREGLHLSKALSDQPLRQAGSLVGFIVGTTLVIEVIGALAMWPLWDPALPAIESLGASLFHSVSAFCNAGFALRTDSLEGHRYGWLAHGVHLPMIVVGGLGFPVLMNLWFMVRYRVRRWRSAEAALATPLTERRLSLHSKVVLAMTAGLYLFGVVMFSVDALAPRLAAWLELGQTANQPDVGPWSLADAAGKLVDVSFMSVTCRTAGFNAMPMEELGTAGRMVAMMLMTVGGSPGGTAGGTKTTVMALLLLSVIATVRQRDQTEAFSRRIADSLVRKAATLGIGYVGLISAATLALAITEPFPFVKILFEVVSAATTTGLSLGITGDLSPWGRGIIIVTMFLGRVGPLALAGAVLVGSADRSRVTYAREEVLVG